MKVTTVAPKTTHKVDETTLKDMIRKARKEYEKPCKGMFEFIDAQGGWISFTDRPFPGDPILVYRIDHGEICELPLGLVKRLNNTKKKVRKARMDADNKDLKVYDYQSRIRFTPMDVI